MNYLWHDETLTYPSDKYSFNPSENYPEYPFGDEDIAKESNAVYEAIRQIFYHSGLDSENYGTRAWNPLGVYIRPGQNVLIKPNLVMHINGSDDPNDLECLVTHPSIIRCVLDYVVIALKGKGNIYVGDSPVKDCNFQELLNKGSYILIDEFYRKREGLVPIWTDLRGPEEERQSECEWKGILVNLGKKSNFYEYKNDKGLRIPNYDYRKVRKHHSGNTQEYMLNELVLNADVIISLPKPKTHRKAGYTGALKNFVGINYSKEYLPHHTQGCNMENGDEYESKSYIKKINSRCRQLRDIYRTMLQDKTISKFRKKNIVLASKVLFWMEKNMVRLANKLAQYQHKDLNVYEGTWYQNDTLWRTVLDLYYAVVYTDKKGVLRDSVQRTILHLGDMVVSGEKEGPLAPSPKKVHCLLFSTNAVEFDAILVRIMHFKREMLMTIKKALESRLSECCNYEEIMLNSNDEFCSGKLKELKFEEFDAFIPAYGWKGYIENF